MSEKQVFKAQQTVQECAVNSGNGHTSQGYAPEQIIVRLLGSVVLKNTTWQSSFSFWIEE